MTAAPQTHSTRSTKTVAKEALALLLLLATLACLDGPALPTAPGPLIGDSTPPTQTVVGVVGCSQTTNAWRGWIDTGDDRVWQVVSGYGGGDVVEWATGVPDGDYWRRLDANSAANATATVVWWQLCDLALDSGLFGHVEAILAEIRERIPGASVYASPLAEFERPETCVKMNVQNSNRLVDFLVATGQVRRGPDLPRVLSAWIQPPQGDGQCHVGSEGRTMFGLRLASFSWQS